MLLREFKTKAQGLPDLLPWVSLIENGVVLLKDGSFLTTATYRGPDTESASPAELNAISRQINEALKDFGAGWMLQVDAVRCPVQAYPEKNFFSSPVASLIDLERRELFSSLGELYETTHFLTLTFKPEPENAERAKKFLLSSTRELKVDYSFALKDFIRKTTSLFERLSNRFFLSPLSSEELLSFLASSLATQKRTVTLPSLPVYLDSLLAIEELYCGLAPRIGEKFLSLISLASYPLSTHPEALGFLTEMSLSYRWSSRFIFLSNEKATRELTKYRKNWFQKRLGLQSFVKESFNMEGQSFLNSDALSMAEDANAAICTQAAGESSFGYYTSTLVLSSTDEQELQAQSSEVIKRINQTGFLAKKETINAVEAFLGTIPGNSWQNIRKPLLQTRNLSDLMPLTSPWPGLELNPSPRFSSSYAPALMQTVTSGSTPFRLNLHVSDVGHTLVVGPTGSGKSTLVGLMIAQFFRYKDAQVFCFDKGRSQELLTAALSGEHFELGVEEAGFYPLGEIEKEEELLWAADWLETLVKLQGVNLEPRQRAEILKALRLLSKQPSRTLTELEVQDEAVREALEAYTLSGGLRILDASSDSIGESRLNTFELETILSMGEKSFVPVLLYLFHLIERRLTGQPTLIVLEEAWLMLGNELFSEKINDWLRTLRKKNASVLFLTQSLSEIVEAKSSSVILDSCPTRIFLPNPEASSSRASELYASLGLTQRQIEIIAQAEPKRHYYYTSPRGKRLFELSLGETAKSFVAVSDPERLERFRELRKKHPKDFLEYWYKEQMGNENNEDKTSNTTRDD